MLETTYLKCAACYHSWPVDTPKSNEELRKAVKTNSTCRCGCTVVLQAGYTIRKRTFFDKRSTNRKGFARSGYAAKSV